MYAPERVRRRHLQLADRVAGQGERAQAGESGLRAHTIK